MKAAVLSGKGGAGKTFVAVNLAAAAGRATYVDCDVEEPNGRLFLKPEDVQAQTVGAVIPEFDAARCTGCRRCVDFCRFNALIYIKGTPRVFPEVCHGCGGCALVCPAGAVREIRRPVGTVETGRRGDTRVITGVLNLGEASGVGVIRAALEAAKDEEGLTVIDCPPGSACTVMESVADADLCLLIAEPTAFGFHNFKMVHELCTLLDRRCAVVINKEDAPYAPLEAYCREQGLPVLARIPYSEETARLAAAGEIACERSDGVRTMFDDLLAAIGGDSR